VRHGGELGTPAKVSKLFKFGGDLASSALSKLHHPQPIHGVGLVFGNFAIGTAERIGASLAQEFLFGKFTRRGRHMK
jgi:hypothetical protein